MLNAAFGRDGSVLKGKKNQKSGGGGGAIDMSTEGYPSHQHTGEIASHLEFEEHPKSQSFDLGVSCASESNSSDHSWWQEWLDTWEMRRPESKTIEINYIDESLARYPAATRSQQIVKKAMEKVPNMVGLPPPVKFTRKKGPK